MFENRSHQALPVVSDGSLYNVEAAHSNGSQFQSQVHPVYSTSSTRESVPVDRESLYRDFQPLIRRLIRQYGSDDHEMRNDLAGEIYYRFDLLLNAYDPDRGVPLRPYLVRQLTASVYTYARHQWRNQKHEASLDELMKTGDPGRPVDPTPQWQDDIALEQVLQSLPDAIARLPHRQKLLVIWRYYDQRSFEEIADTLSVRPATARSILRHGLNNLRKWMVNSQTLTL